MRTGRHIYPLRGMLRIVSGFPQACLYFRTHLHLDCLRLQPQLSVKWRMVRASVHFAAAKQFADSIEAQSPSIKFPQLGMVTRFGVAPKSALAG